MLYRCVETEEESIPPSSPERRLLTAILDMAYRDLNYATQLKNSHIHLHRRLAVAWFRSKDTFDCSESSFTFEEIKSELNLSAKRVEFILDRVRAAEKILEIEQAYVEKMVREDEEKDKRLR